MMSPRQPGNGGGSLGTGIALLLTVLATAAAAAQTVTPDFDGARWLGARDSIGLVLAGSVPAGGRIAVLIGHTDYSALFLPDGPRLVYRPRRVPLPPGEHDVTVYLVGTDRRWTEIGRFPLRVLTAAGLEDLDLVPRLALNNKGQVAEGHDPAGAAPTRSDYQDLAVNTGFQAVGLRGAWSVQVQSNFVGVSNRQEALRFRERAGEAPKFDLADYMVTLERGAVSASVGHIVFGQHRHLLTGFGSRGLTASARIGGAAELSFAALNGSSIVGWSNPVGLSRPDHRVLAGSLGLQLVPSRPGTLQIELTALDGSVLPFGGFNQGVVNDAEESTGGALRLVASDASQRVRIEAGYSRSRFTNPFDPTLSQGADVVPVTAVTRNARYLDAWLAVLRGARLSGSLPLSVSLAFRHEQVDPLYRSVGSFTSSDVAQNGAELQVGAGPLSLVVGHTRTRDNLEDVASILTTRTRTTSVNGSVALGMLAGNPVWLPSLGYTLLRMHQFGEGVPLESEFAPTHVPDQLSLSHSVSVRWQTPRWQAGYRLNLSDQDNRQIGREAADFLSTTHNITLGVTPVPSLSATADVGFELGENEEQAKENRTHRYAATLDWRFTSTSAFAVSLARTRNYDDPRTADQDVKDVRLQLSQRLPVLRLSNRSSAAQAFVRYSWQYGYTYNPLRPATERRNWAISTGFTMGVF